jgi:hypothetical protein
MAVEKGFAGEGRGFAAEFATISACDVILLAVV